MTSSCPPGVQTCICTNRLLVQSGVHEQFVEELSKAVRGLKQGDPFIEGVNLGPLINEPAAKKVRKGEEGRVCI